ncbi:MAG TPA: hypothetical protein VFL80_03070, partial [Thermoanaerobaculia bacterium]|nr:hypothetical protein [Thermoanaerobaculia bacterium]
MSTDATTADVRSDRRKTNDNPAQSSTTTIIAISARNSLTTSVQLSSTTGLPGVEVACSFAFITGSGNATIEASAANTD